MENYLKATPENYSTVCTYLLVNNPEQQLSFIEKVFAAETIEALKQDNLVMHAEVRIGNSVIMIGRAQDQFPAAPGMMYIFTSEVDRLYQLALSEGAVSLMEPGERYYGHRECGVKDPQGNQWWMASVTEKLSPQELQNRTETQRKRA